MREEVFIKNILIKTKLVRPSNIIIDSKSGYSGAGRGVHKRYINKNLYESLSAYGIGFHRHNPEIKQYFTKYSKKKSQFYLYSTFISNV